jgi:hypothetical protein
MSSKGNFSSPTGLTISAIYSREKKDREEKSPGLALLAGAHTDIFLEGSFSVRHCHCVLARSLGKETTMLFPCYGIFSAI